MTKMIRSRVTASLLLLAALAGCHKPSEENAENFGAALNAYLAERGDLCVGKTEWPIDVSEREFELGTRDAKQMPVLERLGLVSSWDTIAERKNEGEVFQLRVKRYQLTDAGQKYYHQRTIKNAQGEPQPSGDLCAARLSLDKVTHWQASTTSGGHRVAALSYTYHVNAAPWTSDPDIQKVFPAVTRVVQGAEKAELVEGVTLTDNGWVADDLIGVPPSAKLPGPAQASAR